MKIFDNKFITAFTLAETLITLAIIGVVAAITVPGLINNIKDNELKASFEKTYASLDQATRQIMQENGGTMVGICADDDHACQRDKYSMLLKAKSCDTGSTLGACWHANDGSSKYLNGVPITTWGDTAGLVLNNGAFLRFIQKDDMCQSTFSSTIGQCGLLLIDVNGIKKPNTYGKDIFEVHIFKNGIKPYGFDGDTDDLYNCSKTSSGYGCAAKVLLNEDY